jgi:hypothetical protein
MILAALAEFQIQGADVSRVVPERSRGPGLDGAVAIGVRNFLCSHDGAQMWGEYHAQQVERQETHGKLAPARTHHRTSLFISFKLDGFHLLRNQANPAYLRF